MLDIDNELLPNILYADYPPHSPVSPLHCLVLVSLYYLPRGDYSAGLTSGSIYYSPACLTLLCSGYLDSKDQEGEMRLFRRLFDQQKVGSFTTFILLYHALTKYFLSNSSLRPRTRS